MLDAAGDPGSLAPSAGAALDAPAEAIAIVGMACRFQGIDGLAEYWRYVAAGARDIGADPSGIELGSPWQVVAAALDDAGAGTAATAPGGPPAASVCVLAIAGAAGLEAAAPATRALFAETEILPIASSAAAVDLVLGRLRNRTCDVGIVVGVGSAGPVADQLSAAGNVSPYTWSADGNLARPGCGVIVLKRHSDTQSQEDRIYALIVGVGRSSDPRAALSAAYAAVDMDPSTVGLIEGEGAADSIQDGEELAALHAVFGKSGFPEVALGAASSVVGATGQAACLAAIIKAALAIHHRALPPAARAETPHEDIATGRLYLGGKLRPWLSASGVRRRAGVSARDGIGHCHAILEEPPAESRLSWRSLTPWRSELIVIAGPSRAALRAEIQRVRRVIAQGLTDSRLGDLAFTLVHRLRDADTFRLATVVHDTAELAIRLALVDERLDHDSTESWKGFAGTYFGSVPYSGRLGFLFPGVGFPGLAGGYADRIGELALHFPDMLDWLDRAETITGGDDVSYRLSFQLFPPPYCDLATLAEIEEQLKWSQRASVGTMVANLATYALVRGLGIRPDAMAGFSLGEWSALVAAGIIDLETAARAPNPEQSTAMLEDTQAYRGRWAMAGASADDIAMVIQPLGDAVSVTIDVSPDQVFIGGEETAVEAALALLGAAGIWASAIPSSPLMTSFSAFHTKHAAAYGRQMHAQLSAMPLKRLEHEIYSSVSGRLFPPDPEQIVPILAQNVTETVRVRETISTMHKEGIRIFLQLGGGGRLLPTVQKNLVFEPHTVLSIDVEYLPGLEQLQTVLAQLLALGISLDPALLYRHRLLATLDLDEAPRAAQPPAHPRAPDLSLLAQFFDLERRAEDAVSQQLARFLDHARASLLVSRADAVISGVPRSPLLGEIIGTEPGRKLTSRLLLDLAKHHFLGQHVLLAEPGELKPARDLLPTLPFAFAVEIMAQAAQALQPAMSVLDCHDMEANSWISLVDADTLALLVVAESVAESVADGEIQVDIFIEGEARPAMRGRVAMGRMAPAPAPKPHRGGPGCKLSAAEYYAEGPLFQGPLFRNITALHAMSSDAISGEVVLRDPADMAVGGDIAPIFDPILLDSVAQMLGVPAWIDDQRLLVPIRVKRVSRHASLPPPGTLVQAGIGYRRLDERRTEGDFDVVGPAGDVLLRVEGWQEIWVIWPKCLVQRNHRAKEGAIGRSWHTGDGDLSCYRTRRDDFGDVDPAWIARYYLTPREWRQYAQTPRLDWLLGRVAAKDAVRDWFARHRGVALHPLEVEIANLPGGAPVLLLPEGGPASISIAHLADEAIAVASSTAAVGVDIVRLADRDEGFLGLAFDDAELACLPPAVVDRMDWVNRAWCAKEAGAKACGRGYDSLPRLRIQRIGFHDGAIEIFSELDDHVMTVTTLLDGDHAMAFSSMRHHGAFAPALS